MRVCMALRVVRSAPRAPEVCVLRPPPWGNSSSLGCYVGGKDKLLVNGPCGRAGAYGRPGKGPYAPPLR